MNTSTAATIVSLLWAGLCVGCMAEGDLGSRSLKVSEATPAMHTPACTPLRPPPTTCLPVPNADTSLGIAEACVVDESGTVSGLSSGRVTLPAGTPGVFVAFNDFVVQPELAWPTVLAGPLGGDLRRTTSEVSSCWTTVADRRGLWVTLDKPIVSPTSVSVIVNFPTTHPLASLEGCVSCGQAGYIVGLDIAAAP